MKKAIVLLLALAVLGSAAFAQAALGVYLEGEVLIIDQDGVSSFNPDGDTTFGTITFKGTAKDASFSMTFDNNWSDGAAGTGHNYFDQIRDWNVSYNLFDKMVKTSLGKLRDGTYRMGSVYEKSYMSGPSFTDRIAGYGMLTHVMPIDGLSLGLNVPFIASATGGAATEDLSDTLQKVDLGAKYAFEGFGNFIFMANLNLVDESNVVNFGFNLTAVENLAARLLVKATLVDGNNVFGFNTSAKYTMDALSFGAEFVGANREADLVVASVVTQPEGFNWKAFGKVGYVLNDNISFGGEVSYASVEELLDFNATATYDFGVGLESSINFGYNETAELYYSLNLFYTISL